MKSIQRTLQLRLLGALLLVLGGAGLGLFVLLQHLLVRSFDQGLAAKARVLAGMVQVARGQIEPEFDEAKLPEFERQHEPEYFELRTSDGKVHSRSKSLQGATLTGPDMDRGLRGNKATTFWDLRLPDHRRGRAVVLLFLPRIKDNDLGVPPPLMLLVGRNRESLDEAFRSVLLALGLVGGVLLLLIPALISVVARRGLRPLRDLADRAGQIDARTLSARFPISDLPRELLPICQRLNDLLDRVSTSMARERRFSADAAHELRTPLAELRTIADVSLAQDGLGPDMTAALQDIRSSAVQLDRVVSTLLALARCEAGQQMVNLQTVSLSEAIRDVVRPFEVAARSRGLTVTSGSGEAMVQADRALLVAIITNLFSNAVAYTPDGGRIAWSLAETPDRTILRLENTNPGLVSADLVHVFEPFWRRDAARTGGEHVGVGLALVAAYTQLMGAEATVSLPNAATVAFDLRLPRSVPDQ